MKRSISLALTLIMVIGLFTFLPAYLKTATDAGPVEPYSKGDVNGDGYVSAKDILLFKKYLACKVEFNAAQLTAADINGDGNVNSRDRKYVSLLLTCDIVNFSSSELAKYGVTDNRHSVRIGGVEFNQNNYCIVMPVEFKNADYASGYNVPDGFQFAVRRLKGFLGSICGSGHSLNIVGTDQPAVLANYPHKIYCLAAPMGTYENEAFNIRTSNGDVYLTCSADPEKYDTQRGMFYAVFTFLEDYFDVRFYEDEGPYIPPRAGAISIPNGINRTVTPGFKYRLSAGWSFSNEIGNSALGEDHYWEQPAWYLITRKMNGCESVSYLNKRQTGYAIGTPTLHAHSLGYYTNTTNPSNGFYTNPCLYVAPGDEQNTKSTLYKVENAIARDISTRKGNNEHLTEISCSIEDVVKFCTCSNCKAKYSYYGCFNGIYMEFVNKVADWLEENYPDDDLVTYSVL
ncbi:MAG: hypothetical protein IJT91_04970, partial [Clostridia bacterium]|nr:hypothetical protein [Clostridia bacterium]